MTKSRTLVLLFALFLPLLSSRHAHADEKVAITISAASTPDIDKSSIASTRRAYLVKAMLGWVPPQSVTGWETKDENEIRRGVMADDFLAVAFDPAESALFKGSVGRMQTALFLASIASFESGYDVRIDKGRCDAMPGGITAGWCDFGRSSSIMQVMTSGGGKTKEGYSKKDLTDDRKKGIRAALHILQDSAKMCSSQIGIHVYSAYAQGFCGPSQKIQERFDRAAAFAKANMPPLDGGAL